MKFDNISKIEHAMQLAEILTILGYTVTIAKYKPNPKTNAYKWRVLVEVAG